MINPGNINDEMRFTAIILAAGSSGRMGTDKASLHHAGDLTFSNYLVNRFLEAGAGKVVLVVNKSFTCSWQIPDKLSIIMNHHVDRGRSYSIRLAINEIQGDLACFIHNVDNPYLNLDLLRRMLMEKPELTYLVPVFDQKGGHPLLLGPGIVNELKKDTEWSDFRTFLQDYPKAVISCKDNKILYNINTPEDYARFILDQGQEQ
jgi:molybdenum cofactor cytidylyltransferase